MYRHWPGLPTMTVTNAIHTKRYSVSCGKWTNRHQLSLNGKQDNFTMEDLQKVGENMGIREHKQIIEKVQETVSYWHETAKDCGVKPEHADFS